MATNCNCCKYSLNTAVNTSCTEASRIFILQSQALLYVAQIPFTVLAQVTIDTPAALCRASNRGLKCYKMPYTLM